MTTLSADSELDRARTWPAPRRRHHRRRWLDYVFLLPALVVFAMFTWYPIGRGIALAFQKTNLLTRTRWVGFDNFTRTVNDPGFALAWRNTAFYTGLALVIGFVIPLIAAVAISEVRHARGYLRLLVYLPVMLPPVVSILLWKWMYDPGPGLFNQARALFGLPPSQWVQSADTAMICLVVLAVWTTFGTTTLIYAAGLQGISGRLYEAAEIDGAGFWRRVWHVTLPQMRYVLLVMLLLQVIGTMQVFTEPYVMTDGGPNGATTTVVMKIYEYAFVYGDFGRAGALSVMLIGVLAVFSAAYLALTRRWST